MKKFLSLSLIILSMLTMGIGLLCSKIEYVNADYSNFDGANFVLTGYNGYNPSDYFTTSDGQSRLVNAKSSSPDKNYLNSKGEATTKYNYISGKISGTSSAKSSGSSSVFPGLEMKKIIQNGEMVVKVSCGLLSLKNNDQSKVKVYLDIITTSGVYKTLTLTSSKVSSNSSQYEPEWVSSEYVVLPTDTAEVKFYFENLAKGSLTSQPQFCIFEPTIFFGTMLKSVTLNTQSQSLKPGQVLKLSSSNSIYNCFNNSSSDYANYYKDIHSIKYQITQGQEYANIVGNYIYVDDLAPENSVIKVRAYCRQSSTNANFIYSEEIELTVKIETENISVITDFEDPAIILGRGNYFVGDYATLTIQPKDNFNFLQWNINGEKYSEDLSINFEVKNDMEIKAMFTKTISVKNVEINEKVYDGTKNATINKIVLQGVENLHDVELGGITAEFVSCDAGINNQIKFNGTPNLVGSNASLYVLNSDEMPNTTAKISPKSIKVSAKACSQIYGDNATKLDYDVSGLINGEKLNGKLSRENSQNVNVGEYNILIGTLQQENPNYLIDFQGAKYTITKREISITQVSVVPKVYDAKVDAMVEFKASNILQNDNIEFIICAEFIDKNVGVSKQVNIKSVAISGEKKDNYTLKDIPQLTYGTINKKPLQLTVENQTFTYGNDYTIPYTVSGLIDGDELTGKLALSDYNVGRHIILIGTLNNNNYNLSLNEAFATINQKKIEVKANNINQIYGDNEKDLTYTVTGLKEGDLLSGKLIRETGETVGDYSILLGTLNNSNYDIDFISAIYSISKRQLNIDFKVLDKIYDGTTNLEFEYQIQNIANNDEIKVKCEMCFQNKNVGINKNVDVQYFDVSGDKLYNYSYLTNLDNLKGTILAKDVIISSQDCSKTYGEEDIKIDFVASGLIQNEEIVGNLSRIAGENVGKYPIMLSQDFINTNSNYNISFDKDYYYTIEAKTINISIQSSEKQFGDVDPLIVYVYDVNQLCFDDTFNSKEGSASRQTGEEVGRYKYTLGSLSLGKNYNINFIDTGYLTINKRAISISVLNCEKTYGESDPQFVLKFKNTIQSTPAQIEIKREKGENVGEYKITYVSLDDSHYEIDFECGYLTILPRNISIKAEDNYKYYGEIDPDIDLTIVEGMLAFNDSLEQTLTGEISREVGEDIGTYNLIIGSLQANENYSLEFICGQLTILPQDICIKINDACKEYGENDPEFNYTVISGTLISQDDIIGKAKRTIGEELGCYLIDIGTICSTKNYNLTCMGGVFTINPRNISIKAKNVSKIYGDEDPQFEYQIIEGSLLENDYLLGGLYRNGVGQKLYENAGKYEILSTLNNPNYLITFDKGTLTIEQRPIEIRAKNYQKYYGDEIEENLEYEIVGEIKNSDTLIGGLYKVDGNDAGVYPIRSNITLGRNYKITYIGGKYEILPIPLTVTCGYNVKVYGSPDPNYEFQILSGNLINDDVLYFEISREINEKSGIYELTILSNNINYEISTFDSILEIQNKKVYLNVEVLDKTYDGTDICHIKNPIVSGLVDNEIILDYDKNNCARFAQIEPGNNIKVTLHDVILLGNNAENYDLILPENLKANITLSNISSNKVTLSTYNSTVMKVGTTLQINGLELEKTYDNKKVLTGFSASVKDNTGSNISLDRAMELKIELFDVKKYNNIRVYAKDGNGNFDTVAYKIEGNGIVLSTNSLSEYIIVCDDEDWIDYALVACIGLLLGICLTLIVIKIKRSTKNYGLQNK